MFTIRDYGAMIQDGPRMDAHARALERAITPGCVVADIGAGTGIFALLACRLGARRVFAVEAGDAIGVAREVAAANGFSDRIEFFHAASTDVSFPERADVIVSDLRGILPLFGSHFVAIADARRRLLAPGGVIIPQQDTLWSAIVEAPGTHARVTSPWESNDFGLDMSAGARLLANSLFRLEPAAEDLASEAKRIATFDYRTLDDPDFRTRTVHTITRAATAHGICLWFDSVLSDGIEMSNAPGRPPLVYATAFLPWPEAVHLQRDDEVRVDLRADLVGGEYVWSWISEVLPAGGGAVRHKFRQSDFFGEPVSPDSLRKRAASHVPRLGENGRMQRLVLEEMERGSTLAEISRRLAAQFPHRFPRWEEALSCVADISEQFDA